jgi:methyltransferase
VLTRTLFTALWLLVVAQRCWEMRLSKRHEERLRRAGAVEHARAQMPWMVALHAAWLTATLLEVWLLAPVFRPALAIPALLVFAAGQTLRILAIRTLGERWTVRVLTPSHGEAPVTRGIYRSVRHPNYLGVVLEILSLPLVHSAYLSALVFSLLNGWLLRARIRAEERALAETSAYGQLFAERPRFVPDGLRP